ncbi:MAG: hypothetical protein IKQ16_10055 [Lentisphaeria bacterium]|nr:hypothetical protein [Lentisphaeria bacterium]
MTWEKTLVRHLLFAAASAALGFCCAGCLSAAVLSGQFGSKRSRFDIPKYRMSPDRDEIIVSSERETSYHTNRMISRRTWKSTWEGRIPLDPVPECLMRCRLIAEPDPDAQAYWHNSPFVIETDGLPLGADETLRLRVRPDELDDLSRPFKVRLIPRGEEDVPPEQQPEGELRIMFPVAVDGNTYELLTLAPGAPRENPFMKKFYELDALERKEERERNPYSYFDFCGWLLNKDGHNYHNELLKQAAAEWDAREEYRYLYPFRDGMDEVRLIEYERIAGRRFPAWDAVLWKTLYLPPAIVLDTLLLPGYIAGSAYLYLLYVFVYSALGGIQ